MGIDNVKKEILDQAKKEAQLILKEADIVKKEIIDAANVRVDSIKNELDQVAKQTISHYKTMMEAESNSILKKEKLKLEKDLIDEVFENTLIELEKLDSKSRTKDVKKLVKGQKYSSVFCSKKDMAALKSLKPKAVDIIGGVILQDSKEEVRLDLSYETLLQEIRQDNLAEVAKVLF
jgi:vacuolar-type H+-ATPase subunit E/Vma4